MFKRENLRNFFFAILILFFGSSLLYYTFSDEPLECNESKGIGSTFYKFDKIVIDYGMFITGYSTHNDEFPPIFKFENFNDALTKAVKENFSTCLKRSFLKIPLSDKPVVYTRNYFDDDLSDPSSLVIYLKVLLGTSNVTASKKIATITYTFIRPGFKGKDILKSLGPLNGNYIFEPNKDEADTEENLKKYFWDNIRPRSFYASKFPASNKMP